MNTADVLMYGHRTVCRVIDGLPESAVEAGGACGVWSVKDVVGHLGAYERLLEDILAALILGGGSTPTLDAYLRKRSGPPDFNDEQAAARKSWSMEQVFEEYNSAHERIRPLVPQVPPETWRKTGALPWYGPQYDLEDFIVYQYYGHKREHSAQIAAFRDTLK